MSSRKKAAMNFQGMQQSDVPQGRNGKHQGIVSKILSDLDQVEKGVALRVPLAQLTDSKERVRSALNRATRKRGRTVATASDGSFLYVWNEEAHTDGMKRRSTDLTPTSRSKRGGAV